MKRFFVILSLAAALTSCTTKEKKQEVAAQPVTIATKATSVDSLVISQTEQFTSEIDPFKENDITTSSQGVHIERIFVEVGDYVSRGAVLATLDPTMVNRQKVQLTQLEQDYDRLKPVFEAGGISAQQIDQAKTQVDIQREVVANLEKNNKIVSPITGIVTARNYEAGDMVGMNPLLHIMQIDKLKVLVNISEQYFASVKEGMSVDMVVDIFPDEQFVGHVSLIYPALDAATRTFKVEVTVGNAARKLRPGMFARTTFNMGDKGAIVADDIAIQKQVGSAENFVYVIKDGVAERRKVKTGRTVGNKIEILSGLTEGEMVATTAFSRLYNGAKVELK